MSNQKNGKPIDSIFFKKVSEAIENRRKGIPHPTRNLLSLNNRYYFYMLASDFPGYDFEFCRDTIESYMHATFKTPSILGADYLSIGTVLKEIRQIEYDPSIFPEPFLMVSLDPAFIDAFLNSSIDLFTFYINEMDLPRAGKL